MTSTPDVESAGWMGGQRRAFLAGVMFLTRLPCPPGTGDDPGDLARSTTYFPVVGAIVAIAGAAAYALGARLWTPLVAAALSTACTVWLTGAFHEDALADSFDGFGGGWERGQVLTIMKDSRVGAYGLVGVALVLALKLGALAALAEPERVARALVAAHVLGRWSSLPLIWRYAYVRETGSRSRPFAASVTTPRLVVGSALAVALVLAALAPLGAGRTLAVLGVAGGATAIGGRYFRRRIGGITGDCLGAANQLVELAAYLALAATIPATP